MHADSESSFIAGIHFETPVECLRDAHQKKKKNNNRDLQSALINIWNENLSTKFPISHEEGMWLQVLLMSNNEQPYKNVLSEGMNDEQDD